MQVMTSNKPTIGFWITVALLAVLAGLMPQ